MNNSHTINALKVLATAMVFFCHSWIVCYELYGFKVQGWPTIFISPAWAGVWIFLITGGYLAAYGFYNGKYDTTMGGVIKYYKNRVVKILIPTWIFLSLEYIFIHQDKIISWNRILGCLTCTYYGDNSSVQGIGAVWYVYIIMWLYLLTPLFIVLLSKIEQLFGRYNFEFYLLIFICIGVLGCIYRIVTYFFLDWYEWTYANVFGCIDLFVAGIISFKMTRCLPVLSRNVILLLRFVSLFLLFVLIGVCVDFGDIIPYGNLLYRYVWPSAFLVLSCALLVLYAYNINHFNNNFVKKVEKIVDIIAPYTFAYYLWHSSMLLYVAAQFRRCDDNLHFILITIIGIIISSYIAFLMTKLNNEIIKTIL